MSGDPWAPGAVGNALWTGVALADVLRAAGAETAENLRVAFQACDRREVKGQRFRYAASIPMPKVMSPEVLLAFEMNGEALAPEHGFPPDDTWNFKGYLAASWHRIPVTVA